MFYLPISNNKEVYLTATNISLYSATKVLNKNDLFVFSLLIGCIYSYKSKYMIKNKTSPIIVDLLISTLLPISVTNCKNK